MFLLFNSKERDSLVVFLCSIFKTATEIFFLIIVIKTAVEYT